MVTCVIVFLTAKNVTNHLSPRTQVGSVDLLNTRQVQLATLGLHFLTRFACMYERIFVPKRLSWLYFA